MTQHIAYVITCICILGAIATVAGIIIGSCFKKFDTHNDDQTFI